MKQFIQIPAINKEFFRNNVRYFLAAGMILLAILYQQLIPPAEKNKKIKVFPINHLGKYARRILQ